MIEIRLLTDCYDAKFGDFTMSINLKKGQSIVLDKSQYDLSNVMMGLGWDVVESKGFFGNLLGVNADFDLDAYAILLSNSGKIGNYKDDVIYYGHLKSSDGTVYHSGDNLTGEGEGDDECIFLRLNSISDRYSHIILGVSIYQAKTRQQHFGQVENAFVRVVDAKGKEMALYNLSADPSYDQKISMLMGELYRDNGKWKFTALGTPLNQDLSGVVKKFM
ncbi:stress protein [Arthrospira platensis C1]|uniref:Tellurium resistance protein n=3 Tax=Limnospira TaxID=2596745 RepID=A0A9P1KLA3_9CYAN|nr:stress protein [Limnospira maxima CS-328]EKD09006.1 stress protein [Arthrospira platensis C1]RAQ42287.1 TerD family protein [Arthrospira sp. O9.13F]UWU45997.1 Stress response protein SCP2 [Arthrospira platensis C1]CDM98076.1 tellurium resistance protein [Limnospira indica PCC 8005]